MLSFSSLAVASVVKYKEMAIIGCGGYFPTSALDMPLKSHVQVHSKLTLVNSTVTVFSSSINSLKNARLILQIALVNVVH